MSPFKFAKRVLRLATRYAGYDVIRFGPLQNEWAAQRALLLASDMAVE